MLNLKKMILVFMVLLFLGSFADGYAKEQKVPPVHLLDIISVMKQQDISVNRWSLYTKRKGRLLQNEKGYELTAHKLKRRLPLFRWTDVKDFKSHLELTGRRLDKATGITERMTLIAYPQSGQLRTYYIYEIEGKRWNPDSWKKFSNQFNDRVDTFFKGNATIFSCVKGHFNGKMDLVLSEKTLDIMNSFSAVPIEQLKEKTFVSVSAYNDDWKASIQTKDSKMNLQIALRSDPSGEAAAVTIGTPIITSEY